MIIKTDLIKQLLILGILLIGSTSLFAQNTPYLKKGDDQDLLRKDWELVKSMSDEFNGKKINEKKWQISGQGWIGRPPGLFLPENINVQEGKLQITANMLPEEVTRNNNTFTHGGGYVGSRESMKYGYYECRMKANKTFMSSTFWLINERKDAKGCLKRTTELDIQECVGEITNDAKWMANFDSSMNSNTHSRDIPTNCDFKQGSEKAKAYIGSKVYDDFHVYGVWWKSEDEVLFFLDGKFHSKVNPPADFNIPMHLRMVVETYDWNPVPPDGGMNYLKEERTTSYDWVRTWKLKE
ncbi:Glycosyl hydrolases family 16 [Salegentibacter agarivorans]|uniref:Glycosyl hydrolases family 16 n=1 Tax=Salegentibacter agarivorans TaxID=345907 RepID=A0A1I2KNZ6_9FLAO|nr:family 16 glycosylhydrolase [Salegentibacter agarivorans]SFF68233.1 Glycosyl hydrolases family 16 [Salegentibacter agarivorans]